MTRYHGGKHKTGEAIAKQMLTLSLKEAKKRDIKIIGYCEPFSGMLGVYRHIPQEVEKAKIRPLIYKAGDTNKSVIMMWQAAQHGWKPSTRLVSQERFMEMKFDGKSSRVKGFVGHYYGFIGQYFRPFTPGPNLASRRRASQKISDIARVVKQVEFSHGSFEQFSNLKGYIIYCDPPYQVQSHYYTEDGKSRPKFNHSEFWDWCRNMSQYNIVLVSEYETPKDFREVWCQLSQTAKSNRIDRLYLTMKPKNQTKK